MNKPNLLIIGAAKAGSTSLYYYLNQHFNINFSKLKEPKYFTYSFLNLSHAGPGDNSVDKYAIRDKNKYYDLFSNFNSKYTAEASPDYLYYSDRVAKKIYNELGDIPLIIILRNPILRAFSAYSYLKRDNREKYSFKEALDLESKRISMNYDFIWHYKSVGNYSSQIKYFSELFSNIHFILFDDLVTNPLKACNDVFKFLNLETLNQIKTTIHNPSGNPKNLLARFILNRRSSISTFTREMIKFFIPRKILENLASRSLERNLIDKESFEYLAEYYIDEISYLENLLNRDLSTWKEWKHK